MNPFKNTRRVWMKRSNLYMNYFLATTPFLFIFMYFGIKDKIRNKFKHKNKDVKYVQPIRHISNIFHRNFEISKQYIKSFFN